MKYLQNIESGKYYYANYDEISECYYGWEVDDIQYASEFYNNDYDLGYIIADLAWDFNSIRVVEIE